MKNLNDKLIEKIKIVNDVSIMNSELLSEIIGNYKESKGLKDSEITERFYEDPLPFLILILESVNSDKVNSFTIDNDYCKNGDVITIKLYKL